MVNRKIEPGELVCLSAALDEAIIWQALADAEHYASASERKRKLAPNLAVGFVPANPQLSFSGVWETVGEELAQIAACHQQSFDEVINTLKLHSVLNSRPQDLSGGESVLAAIGLVLASRPSIWVLDRCFEWLEPMHRQLLVDFFVSELKSGVPIVELESGRGSFVSGSTIESSILSPRDLKLAHQPQRQQDREIVLQLTDVTIPLSRHFEVGPVTLTIRGGERVALLGPNGAGKSTLAKAAAGLIDHRGVVKVAGALPRARRDWSRSVLYSFQNPDHQIFRASASREIEEAARRIGKFDKERVRAIVRSMGLESVLNKNPFSLPLSQRRLVTIAASLAAPVPLAIIDEPTAFLNSEQVEALKRAIDQFVELGGAVLAITHDFHFASSFASRLLELENGKLVFDSSAFPNQAPN